MDFVILIFRIFVSYIFIISGWLKTVQLNDFEKAVSRYQILPKNFEKPFAFIISKLEIITGIMIGLGLFTEIAALIITGFLIMFLTAFSITMIRRRSIDCGCFGAHHSQKIGWPLILRDAVLILMALCIFFYRGGEYGLDKLLKIHLF